MKQFLGMILIFLVVGSFTAFLATYGEIIAVVIVGAIVTIAIIKFS